MFKKHSSTRNLILFFVIFSVWIVASCALMVRSQDSDKYERLYPSTDGQGRGTRVIDSNYKAVQQGGLAGTLVNYGTKDLFIPLNTGTEWAYFRNVAGGLNVGFYYCGDGDCGSGENAVNCALDCTICGDAYCTGNENIYSCSSDCTVCGDGYCTAWETCSTCPQDCAGCVCESPETCPSGQYCAGLDAFCKDEMGRSVNPCEAFTYKNDCNAYYGCEWRVRDNGMCSFGTCYSNCYGKNCGPDGCGGSCGGCIPSYYCSDSGTCMSLCGNGTCGSGENASNCSADCPTYCGDGYCTGYENPSYCLSDCATYCGDGYCAGTETCSSCSADCGTCAAYCGDGSCNGSETCSSCSGDCGACPTYCGDGSCNGSETCSSCSGDCGACAIYCGDYICNGAETCSTCSNDCGACATVCGNGSCSGSEDCWSCPSDCGGCGCYYMEDCPLGETCEGTNARCRDYGGYGGCTYQYTQLNCEAVGWCEWEPQDQGTCTY